jgi:hypothetical protein
VRRWPAALAAFSALSLLVAAVVLGQTGPRGTEISSAPSAANLGPRGLAAAWELLRSTGAAPIRRGPGDAAVPGAAVVIVAAPSAALGAEDVSSLLAEAGGGAIVIVALGSSPQPALLDGLGLGFTPGAAPRQAHGLAPHRLVGDLSLPARSAAISIGRPGALAVSGAAGWASAVSVPAGRGEVLVLSGPEPLENANLLQGDAASLVARLGALGPVVFDERFAAGPRPAGPPSRRALALLAAQILAAGAALALARGRRLGAIRPPPDLERGRTARDYLSSLAGLYRRAGAEGEMAAQAWYRLRRRLERRWNVPSRLSDAQAARRIAGRNPEAALALARGGAALAGGGAGVLLRVTRAAADAERALERRVVRTTSPGGTASRA